MSDGPEVAYLKMALEEQLRLVKAWQDEYDLLRGKYDKLLSEHAQFINLRSGGPGSQYRYIDFEGE